MHRTTRWLTGMLLAPALLAACNDNPFLAGNFAVDGPWAGRATVVAGADTTRFEFRMELEQDRNDVTGTGVIQTAQGTFPVEIDGRWDYPSVDLTFRSQETAPLVFDAAFDVDTVPRTPSGVDIVVRPDTLQGVLTGSGLTGVPLAIGRAEDE